MDHFVAFIFSTALLFHLGNPLFATNKLSLATWGSYSQREHKGPGTYAYGFDIEDPVTGNIQFKQEEKHPNGVVTGSYGYVDSNGVPRVTHYISDMNGYRIVTAENVVQSTSPPANHQVPTLQEETIEAATSGLQVSSDRVVNPPPLMFQFHGTAPFLAHYQTSLIPLGVNEKLK